MTTRTVYLLTLLVVMSSVQVMLGSSWNAYIDNLVSQENSPEIQQSWTDSIRVWIGDFEGNPYQPKDNPHALDLSKNEAVKIYWIIKEVEDTSSFYAADLMYQVLSRDDGDTLLGRNDKVGYIFAQTSKNKLVVATMIDGAPVINLSQAVEIIAGYLESMANVVPSN